MGWELPGMVLNSNDRWGGKKQYGGYIMAVISMKQLLEAGVHFGHQTRRWNPKMKDYIFTERNGIYIIDLQKTVKLIDVAYNFMKDEAAKGAVVLFVGTKKQAQDSIEEEATRAGEFYVNHRWLGGTLTNWKTIQSRIARLKELKKMSEDGTFDVLPKKEVAVLTKQREKLERFLGGIEDMQRIPDVMYIVTHTRNKLPFVKHKSSTFQLLLWLILTLTQTTLTT